MSGGADIVSVDTSTLSPLTTAISIGDKAIADFLQSKEAFSKEVPLRLEAQYYKLYLRFPT